MTSLWLRKEILSAPLQGFLQSIATALPLSQQIYSKVDLVVEGGRMDL